MTTQKTKVAASDSPLPKRAERIDPLGGAGRGGVPPGGPKLYHFRDTPERILQLTQLFESLEALVSARRRRLGLGALIGFLVFIAGCIGGGYEFFHRLVQPFVLISLLFLLYIYNIRTLVVRHRSNKTVPGFGAGTGVLMFFGLFFLIPLLTSIQLRWFRAGANFSDTPGRATAALCLSTLFVGVVLMLLNRARLKKVQPQSHELFFVKEILERLLPEVAPNSRCTVAFNPFPEHWSVWETKLKKQGRSAYFDTLLDLRLDLGAERNLALRFLRRRTQKGQRKFKGWKHKLKCKYVLSSVHPLELPGKTKDVILKNVRAQTSRQVSPKVNQHKFLDTIPKMATDVRCGSKDITLTQTFLVTCTSSTELTPDAIPHPEQVLRTIKVLCDAAEGRASE